MDDLEMCQGCQVEPLAKAMDAVIGCFDAFVSRHLVIAEQLAAHEATRARELILCGLELMCLG